MNKAPKPQNFLKVAVGVSGGGRTLLNLIKKQYPLKNYRVVGVFSSSSTCPGLEYAKDYGLPIFLGHFPSQHNIGHGDLKSRHPIYQWFEEIDANFVALAGFLRPFPVLDNWLYRVVNIHPALLPKYGGHGMYGLNVHKAVIRQKESFSGATVHYVTERYDEGQIIAQMRVPVFPEDDAESLANRVFKIECDLYPDTLEQLSLKNP